MTPTVSAAEMLHRNLAHDKELGDEGVIKVTGGADAQSLASAISSALYDEREVVVRGVGASAINQACKAIAITRGYVATRGVDLVTRIGFQNVPGRDGKTISAMVFRVRVE